MPRDDMKRIGIFQYEWALQVHTINLVIKLAEDGFQTDLFLYECDASFVNPSLLAAYPNVRVFAFKRGVVAWNIDRIIRVSRRMLGLPYRHPLVKDGIAKSAIKAMGAAKYDYFIGIEKKGLIWAGKLSEKLGVPFLYYSLELFIEDHPVLDDDANSAIVRREEKKYHARAIGTIIQDALRAKALFESNEVEGKNAIFLPVSITGKKVNERSRFLYEKLGIEFSKKIILYIGQVCKDRGVNDLMKCASRLGNDFVMVFHGPFFHDVSTDDNYGGKVFFSKEIVSNEEIPKIISSAHIGISFYGNANANNRLTAFSSEKIAYYMQSGLPIIAHRNESYELLMRHHHCGELIDSIDLDQFSAAVGKIDADYDRYRAEAFAAYEDFYSFDVNIRNLIEFLSQNVPNPPHT